MHDCYSIHFFERHVHNLRQCSPGLVDSSYGSSLRALSAGADAGVAIALLKLTKQL